MGVELFFLEPDDELRPLRRWTDDLVPAGLEPDGEVGPLRR